VNPEARAVLHRAATITFKAYSRNGLTELNLPPVSEVPVATAVGFDGPRKGRVELHIWKDALGELAANMFDQKEPPPLKDQLDAACEVVNVIAGNVLHYIDSRSGFRLGIPKVLPQEALKAEPYAQVEYALGTGKVEVCLFMDS
jgi:hypothetical protein